MASGNFLVGNGLSMDSFNKYIQPVFNQKHYSIVDKMVVGSDSDHSEKILLSIVGDGFLDRVVNDVLIECGESIDKENKTLYDAASSKGGRANPSIYTHQVMNFSHWEKRDGKDVQVNNGIYKSIGLYDHNDTASKLFPILAQTYLVDLASNKIDELEEKIKDILDKKLSEL